MVIHTLKREALDENSLDSQVKAIKKPTKGERRLICRPSFSFFFGSEVAPVVANFPVAPQQNGRAGGLAYQLIELRYLFFFLKLRMAPAKFSLVKKTLVSPTQGRR